MRRSTGLGVPLNVQRVRAIVGIITALVGVGFIIFSLVKHEQNKTEFIDIAFGALLIVVGLTRILGYVRARRLRA